jgi:PAS domain S-box-containing protein
MSQPASPLLDSESALRWNVRFAAAGWLALVLWSLLWHAWAEGTVARGHLALHLGFGAAGLVGLSLGNRRLRAALAAGRAADAARARSEGAFRAMFAQNPNPMWVIDRRDFRFLAVNEAALRLYGYTREEFLQLTTLDIRPPEERARLRAALADRPGDFTTDGVWRHWRKSGEELQVEVSSHAIAWEDHDARSVLVIDVTERERSVERLRRSERSLSLAMDLARAGSWEFDAATATLTFTDQLFGLYATSAAQEGGHRLTAETYAREFLLPEERALVAREVEKVQQARDPAASWSISHRIRRRDGAVRHLLVHITPVVDATGRVTGSRGVNQDVTDFVTLEAERRRLARAVDQSPVTVVITDLTGAIDYANPQFTRSTGYTLEEVRGQNPRVLKSGAQPPEVYQQLWATISAGREWRGELCNRRKDGSLFWEEATISPVLDDKGQPTHYLAIKEDITEQRATLEKLREQAMLLEVTRDAIIVVNLDGGVTFWNRAAEKIYGWSAAETAGRDLFSLIYDSSHPPPVAARQAILAQGSGAANCGSARAPGARSPCVHTVC